MSPEDPFAFLGVAPSCDEKTLKRAYGRLVRQHRPEKDPEGFQRVHAAYEEAVRIRQSTQGRIDELGPQWPSPQLRRDTPNEDAPCAPEPSAAPEPNAAPALVEFNAPSTTTEPTPPNALDAQRLNVPTSSVEAPPEAEPYESYFDYELKPTETLAELVSRFGAEGAAHIFTSHVEDLTLAGHTEYLSEQLLSDAAQSLLLKTDALEHSLLFVGAAIAYDDPVHAAALLDRVSLKSTQHTWLEDRLALALTYAEDFKKQGGAALPPAWARLVRLFPIVSREAEQELLNDAVEEMRREPKNFVTSFSRLPESLVTSLGELAFPEEELEEKAAPGTDPTLSSLLTRLESDLDGDLINSTWTWLIVLALFGGIALAVLYGWKGGAAGLVVFLALILVPQNKLDARLYDQYLREPLLRYVMQSGISRKHLVVAVKKQKQTTEMNRFHHEVAEDAVLQLAHQLVAGLRQRRSERS